MSRNKWATATTRHTDGSHNGETKMADGTTEAVKVGLVTKEGSTRGKNPRKITYQAFDTSVPDSLPKSLKEFADITKTTSAEAVLEYVIDGFNAAQYAAASDEIGEFIPDVWTKEVAAQFRLAVRNTSKLTGLSIEDTVNMLKPAIERGLAQAAEKAAAEKAEAVPAVA